MIWSFLGAAVAALALCLVFGCTGLLAAGVLKTVLTVVFAVLAVIFCEMTIWSILMYRAFSYDGKRRMSAQIIEGTAAYVKLPAGGKCLEIKTPRLIQINDLPVAYPQAG